MRSSTRKSPAFRNWVAGSRRCAKRLAASSSARNNWWNGCWSACSPTATSCWKACPVWRRRFPSARWRRRCRPSFHRIQFTPDLLPADIVGTLIYNPQDGKYHATKGPVFANFVLADEINRAPAKVQSALLEAMQERQVTLGGETCRCPRRSSCWRRRTRLIRKARIRCPRRRWIASCSR